MVIQHQFDWLDIRGIEDMFSMPFGKMPDDMCHKHQRHREGKCIIMSKQQSPLSKIRLSLYNIEHHFVKTCVCIHKMVTGFTSHVWHLFLLQFNDC